MEYSSQFRKFVKIILDLPLCLMGGPVVIFCALLAGCVRMIYKRKKPQLIWGSVPIKSLALLSQALSQGGYYSKVVVLGQSSIFSDDYFDYILMPKRNLGRGINYFVSNIQCYLFFCYAVFKFDIFHYYFDGGILRRTFFKKLEYVLLKCIGKKIISIPYGSDAFVYDKIPNLLWRHVLTTDYPVYGNEAKQIENRIRFFTRWSDIVIGCLVHAVNLPRWDVLLLTCYPVEVHKLEPRWPSLSGKIKIAHAPNHRVIKGTQFLIDAVNKLKHEGVDVELDIIEGVSNEESLKRIGECDIFVDQLIFGYALAAQEAMALGKVVVSGLDMTDSHYQLFKNYSYLDECPIVPSGLNKIYEVLWQLIASRREWPSIGKCSRMFVTKRHSFRVYVGIFENIYLRKYKMNQIELQENKSIDISKINLDGTI